MSRIVIATLTAAFLVSGCATVKGAGKDVQSVGQAGEDVIKGKK
jgi:entericidin A